MKKYVEMSNKMKKFFIVFAISMIWAQLSAFVPRERDFSNEYQYEMYQSWLEKSGFKATIPANFSEQTIQKKFKTESAKTVTVEYLWDNWKIYEQREKVADFCDFSTNDMQEQLAFLESFIYRVNCRNPQFVFDIFAEKSMLFFYLDSSQNEALTTFIEQFQELRFEVMEIQLSSKQNRLGFIVVNQKGEHFEIYFPEADDVASILKEMRLLEETRARELAKLKQQEEERLHELENLKEKVSKWQEEIAEEPIEPIDKKRTLKLTNFIRNNHRKLQNRELLHNKIENSETFIYQEFSGRDIQKKGNQYVISQAAFLDQFHSEIRIETKTTKDGIDILPISEYQINEKEIILGDGDSIDLQKLNEQEISRIAPYLCQLLYGHRAMGTKLLNFLLIHDDVPTSLILYGEERELFEMYSYANMILMLHNYWQGRTVYFTLKDFKKVNDFIEFTGFMAARSPHSSTYDFAEIRYQLNHDYRIHLAMMILHPEVQLSETQ